MQTGRSTPRSLTRLTPVMILCLFLSACWIDISVPSSGSVISTSGAMDCSANTLCSIDVNDIHFNETFTAIPAAGFEFVGWKRQPFGLCGGSTGPCPLTTAGAQGNEAFLSILNNPEVSFYLEPEFRSTGFNALFIGHSFFKPFAEGMSFHAQQSAVTEHSQQIVFSGGATGAPMALWNNDVKRSDIQAILDQGQTELFVMTYHPDYPTTEGYELWIEYALAQNPNTRFAIALPWLTEPHTFDDASYSALWKEFHEGDFELGIDFLRRQYPDTDVFAIPYGQAAIELRNLLSAGALNEVEAMTVNPGEGIFRDELGHADDILIELGQLVWLSAIYGIDLDTYDYEAPYSTDLKAIASKILEEQDPEYQAPYL
ncbi:MAG: hypothetical protein AAGI24_09645 [Pseudomonadota bacterium]